jgi:hypothetical protein
MSTASEEDLSTCLATVDGWKVRVNTIREEILMSAGNIKRRVWDFVPGAEMGAHGNACHLG